ncbi:hypothetical protein ACIQM4_04460 [Streptomyces sp. NPDC091272]|uniref:hypothetical protein n=1 Tax=Streptomyces sp. NPDC091272 TaxID=3365981 RepID=UPI00382AA5C2
MSRVSQGLRIGLAALVLGLAVPASATAATPVAKAHTPATVMADKCGNHNHYVAGKLWRYWGSCINIKERIKVDTIFAPDHTLCVDAGSDTALGSSTSVRKASRVGDC